MDESQPRRAKAAPARAKGPTALERTAAALRESEASYRALFEAVPAGLLRTTPAGQVLDANPATLQMLGYPDLASLQAAGMPALYVDLADRRRLLEAIGRDGVVHDFEARWRRRDGAAIDVRMKVRAIRGPDGGVLYEGSLEDVTERRRVTAAFRESEASYRVLFQAVPVALLRTTPDGRMLDANPAMLHLLRYPDLATLQAVHARELYVSREALRRFVELIERDGVVRDLEVQWRRRDGVAVDIRLNVRAVRDRDTGAVSYEGTLEDVTEQKRAEEARSWLAAIVESSEDAIIGTTPEGLIQSWNTGAERLYGYSAAEAIGRSVEMTAAPERVEEIRDVRRRVHAGERMSGFETVRRRKDGRPVHVSLSVSPIRHAGALAGISIVARDITERLQADAAVRRANRALRTLSACNDALIRATDAGTLLREICRIVVEVGGYRFAWIGVAEDDPGRTVRPLTCAGIEEGYLRALEVTWADTEHGRGPAGVAVRTGTASVCRDVLDDPSFAPWRDEALARGFASVLAVPLALDRVSRGVLTIYGVEAGAFDPEEVRLISELATDAAYGLEVLHVRAEHARAVEALRRSEEYFRALTENALDIVSVIDRENRIRYESPSVERVLGYRRDELIGRDALELIHPDDVPAAIRAVTANRTVPGAVASLEFRFRHRDGSWRILEGSGRNMLDDPVVAGIIVNSRDITERRRAEEAVGNILESIGDGFFALDRQERFSYVNRRAEELLRRPREELLGRGIWDAYPEAVGSTFFTEYRRAMAEQVAVRFEEFYPALDTWFEVRAYPSRDGLSVYFADAGERRRGEERLRQSEKLTTLGSLISGVAHELNNPLTVITGFAHLLAGAPDLPERIKRRLGQINAQAERAAKIVKNLLTFARQHPPEQRQVRLGELVDQALDLLAYPFRVNTIQVRKDFPAEAVEIAADPDQLLQVVLNLLQNAMHAMAERERERVVTVRVAPADGKVRLEVEDTGPGIPAAILDRIFDPFFTTKPPGQGTGLGLSICYGIVKAHGGEIAAENVPGGGARFVVELPAGVAAPAPAPAATSSPAAAVGRLRLLVVDDEPEILNLLTEILETAGHQVSTAVNGRTALDRIARGEAYDLILLDMKMPELDGHAVFEELARSRPEAARRVIFSTGDVISRDTQAFIAASGRPAVMKPFVADDIERVLRAALANLR